VNDNASDNAIGPTLKKNSDFNTEAPKYYQTKNGLFYCKYNNCQFKSTNYSIMIQHWQTKDHIQLWNSFKRESIPRSMNEKVDFEVKIVNEKFEINCTHCNKYKKDRFSEFNNKNQYEMKIHWQDQNHICNGANRSDYFLFVIRNEFRYYCIHCESNFTYQQLFAHFQTIHKTQLVKIKVCF
jgi:hypothetical protein